MRKRIPANPNSNSPRIGLPIPKPKPGPNPKQPTVLERFNSFMGSKPKRGFRAQRLRSTIVKTTVGLLRAGDLRGLSMIAIAASTRCSVGAVYGHFANKQALIEGALQRALDEEIATVRGNLARVAASSDSRQRKMEQIAIIVVDPFRQQNSKIIRTALRLALANPHPFNVFAKFRTELFHEIKVATVAAQGRKAGSGSAAALRRDVDAATIATTLFRTSEPG